jgi:hypothetical protein
MSIARIGRRRQRPRRPTPPSSAIAALRRSLATAKEATLRASLMRTIAELQQRGQQ